MTKNCNAPDPNSRRLRDYIPMQQAIPVALDTLPDITAREPHETPAQAAHRILQLHAADVASRTHPPVYEQPMLAEIILKSLAQTAVRPFGFPVITTTAITWFANIIGTRHALEVGAGPALISAELQALGINVTATDSCPPAPSADSRYGFHQTLTNVEPLDAVTAVQLHQPQVLIWSWPEMEPHTNQALSAFTGDDVIYIGEAEDGCTGSPEFHEILNQHFHLADSCHIPNYPGMHDRCLHFTRRITH